MSDAFPHYLFVETEDGSPTLRLNDGAESMHSLRGAFSETRYVYGAAMEAVIAEGWEPRALSMGLGLGYVELLAAGIAARAAQPAALSGESFESAPDLRAYFLAWLFGDDSGAPAAFRAAYDRIAARTAQALSISAADAKSSLRAAIAEERWSVRDALLPDTRFARPFTCICFDAFSSKSTPELWTEAFLDDFLARAAAPTCVFATYARTGALKRSLKKAGFELAPRQGFANKRESTFAVRGAAFKLPAPLL